MTISCGRYQLRKAGRLSSSILFGDLEEAITFLRDAGESDSRESDYSVVEIKTGTVVASLADRFEWAGGIVVAVAFTLDGKEYENLYTFPSR